MGQVCISEMEKETFLLLKIQNTKNVQQRCLFYTFVTFNFENQGLSHFSKTGIQVHVLNGVQCTDNKILFGNPVALGQHIFRMTSFNVMTLRTPNFC